MKHLQLHFHEGVATVTLNRPDVRNAFNDEVIAELTAGPFWSWASAPMCAASCWPPAARPFAPAPT
jgi:1,4-dihydroxy-2-naphthoyl-CoA synthase